MHQSTVVLVAFIAALFAGSRLKHAEGAALNNPNSISGPEVSTSGVFAISENLRDLPGKAAETIDENREEKREQPLRRTPRNIVNKQVTGAVQSTPGPSAAATAGVGFPGIGSDNYGVRYAPPDTTSVFCFFFRIAVDKLIKNHESMKLIEIRCIFSGELWARIILFSGL